MSDAPAYLFERRPTRAYIRALHRGQLNQYEHTGSLYGGVEADVAEARTIRDECEAHGLPMGYGRVGTTPTQLGDEYLPALPKSRAAL